MKSQLVTAKLILVLCAMLALTPVAQGSGELSRSFDVESGQTIELKMKVGGSLEVEGWDKDVVEIVCEANHNDIDDWDIEIQETSKGLKLKAQLKDKSIESNSFLVRLMVPQEFNIKTESAGGHIYIEGVSGKFRGSTGGGKIILENVTGEAKLKTGGGQIKITDSTLDGRVSTGGGGGLVRNVTGNVKATSGGGIVSYENVRDNQGDLRGPGRMSPEGSSTKSIMYATAGGAINISEAPHGAQVKTGGGNIDISNASRFVKAGTGGGDIEIEIENGYVHARTGAGDIEVIVLEGLGDSRDGIDLFTGYGEITLVLPEDASIEFDLDLTYTRNSSRDFKIKSDFDLDIEKTEEWDTRNGSPRKHLYGTGRINGGKHKVIIHAVNGNIRIKEQ